MGGVVEGDSTKYFTHCATVQPCDSSPLAFYMPSIEAAGASVNIEPKIAPVHAKDEIDAVIAAEANYPGGSLIVMPDAFNAANRQLIIASAASHHIPAIYGNNFVNSGGLAYYGANFPESFRLAAGYIDRILRGAKPKDLPIQLPTKFDLAINPKTANPHFSRHPRIKQIASRLKH